MFNLEFVKLKLELQNKNLRNEMVTVEIDKETITMFMRDYAMEYAKKDEWYRLGVYSGNVILHGVSFYDTRLFIENLQTTSILKKRVFEQNPQLKSDYVPCFINSTFIWLYRHIINNYFDEIIEIISIHTTKEPHFFKSELENYLENRDGLDVIYYTFDDDWFAIPSDAAKQLVIEDYHKEVLLVDDEVFYSKIWKFRIEKDEHVGRAYAYDKYLYSYRCG